MLIQKRGKNVAIGGAVLQLVFTAVMLVIWLQTGLLAAMSSTWFLAGGLLLWLMVALLFYCRQLERREALELEELAAGGRAGTIFEGQDQAELRPAAYRAAVMDRFAVPIFTLLWLGYHVAMGVVMLWYLHGRGPGEPAHTAAGTLFAVLIAFLAFLFSNYAVGMSRRAEWRLLRASGSYLLVNTLAMAGVAAALLAANQGYRPLDRIVAYIVPVVQLVLAAELLLNVMLDLYRPRIPGEEARPSFDSRLFNLVSQPGRIGHSIAETLNYQFGFEVSKTWFYRLVSRAFVPVMIFGVIALFGISSIVIVHEGEQAVVLHWGRIDHDRGLLGPGLHGKWPWPIESARRFRVHRVHQVMLGVGEARRPVMVKGRELRLWTQEHSAHVEKDFLIAVPPRETTQQSKVPAVSIVKLVVIIHYVIDDVEKFAFDHVEAEKLLECVAQQQMVQYCATATLDEAVSKEGAPERPEAIMTYGRQRAARELQRRIERVIGPGGLDLGVRIVYLGIRAAHPPAEAAPAFEEVLQAERRRDAQVYEAQAYANQILAQVAGSPEAALQLAFAIRCVEELEKLRELKPDPAGFRQRLEEYLSDIRRDLVDLDAQIERERLLGKIHGEEPTGSQLLRIRYQGHLETLQQIENDPDFKLAEAVARAGDAADEALKLAEGEPAVLVAEAQGQRWQRELAERGRAEAFGAQLRAHQASPRIYRTDRFLSVLEKFLPNIEKYVLTMPRDRVTIWTDLREKMAGLGQEYLLSETQGGK